MKVTKKNTTIFVKHKLATDKKWAVKALVRIYNENQTSEEQVYEDTIVENGIGFTGVDANILSSFAKQQIEKGFLSNKQMKLVMKKMPKYHGQVIAMSDEAKLNTMVSKHQEENQLELKM
jgi:hypothetical protein